MLGSTAGTAKVVIDELRAKGVKAGMLKLRIFRPFPHKQIADALSNVKAVAVLDRSEGMAAMGGPVFAEVRSALYDYDKRPITVDYVYGLGGRDITLDHIRSVYGDLQRFAAEGKPTVDSISDLVTYLGVRE